MHPGGLIVLLLAAKALVAARTHGGRAAFAAIGALGAAVALVKINVGAIALIAAFAAALSITRGEWARRLSVAADAAVICLPVLLIRPDLTTRWGLNLAVLVTAGAVGVVLARRRWAPPPIARNPPLLIVAGAALTTVVVLAIALLAGATPSGLVEGIVTGPLGQRGAFTVPYPVPSPTEALVCVLIVAAAAAAAARDRSSPLFGAALLVGGALSWLSILPGVPDELRLELPALLAWLACLPSLTEDDRRAAFARAFIPLVAVLGVLHAYPVAGSQVAFAAPLFAITGAMAIGRGLEEVQLTASIRRIAGLAVALLAAGGLALMLSRAHEDFSSGVRTSLPGAERVRFQPPDADRYTRLAEEIRRNCDTLITLPGMNSLHLWSGVEPPTGLNATAWMYLFDDAEQRRIVAALERARRPCLVRNEPLIEFWSRGRELPSRPLVEYLQERFEPTRKIGSYELLQPR
jgi:hypothetical protein